MLLKRSNLYLENVEKHRHDWIYVDRKRAHHTLDNYKVESPIGGNCHASTGCHSEAAPWQLTNVNRARSPRQCLSTSDPVHAVSGEHLLNQPLDLVAR